MATVIFTNSDQAGIREKLQQCGLEMDAFVVNPNLLCDSLTRMGGVDLAAVEMGRLPRIPKGSTTLVDFDATLLLFGNSLQNFKEYIRTNFQLESLVVITNICNIVNCYNRMGWKILESNKVGPEIYRIVLKLR